MSNETKQLKQLVGDGGAGHDQSHGSDTLRDVVAAMIDGMPPAVTARQATVATGVVNGCVVDRTGRYDVVLEMDVGTTGTADDTVVEAQANGTLIPDVTGTIDNTDADGTSVRAEAQNVLLTRGDVVQLEVTAAPTAGANGTYSLYLKPARAE